MGSEFSYIPNACDRGCQIALRSSCTGISSHQQMRLPFPHTLTKAAHYQLLRLCHIGRLKKRPRNHIALNSNCPFLSSSITGWIESASSVSQQRMAKNWNWREPRLRELIQIRAGPQGGLVRNQTTVAKGGLRKYWNEGRREPLSDSG